MTKRSILWVVSETIEKIIEITYPGKPRIRENTHEDGGYLAEWSSLVLIITRLITEYYQDGLSLGAIMDWMKKILRSEVESFEAHHESTKVIVSAGLDQLFQDPFKQYLESIIGEAGKRSAAKAELVRSHDAQVVSAKLEQRVR